MGETKKRSIVKGLTWRVLATTDTILLAYIFTGDVSDALAIGGLEVITKTILYYFHERVWLHLPVVFPFFWTEEAPEDVMHHRVSFFKALTWRFFGALDTMILSFIVTGNILASISIGGVEVFTKIFLYYFHDRGWNKIAWGKTARA